MERKTPPQGPPIVTGVICRLQDSQADERPRIIYQVTTGIQEGKEETLQQPPDPPSPTPWLAWLLWKWRVGGQGPGFLAIVCIADAALSPPHSLMGVLVSCVLHSFSPFCLCLFPAMRSSL